MESSGESCQLVWQGNFTKTILFDSKTNVPTFFLAAGTKRYIAHEAIVARANPFYRHKVMQILGHQPVELDPSEFLAKENVNVSLKANKTVTKSEGVVRDPPLVHCKEALTVDFSPPTTQEPEAAEAKDLQAKLMRWHYWLGHLSFDKLKLLAEN